jgi:hypothetical protein
VVTKEVYFNVECALFDKENEACVAVNIGCSEGTREVDVPHLAFGRAGAKGGWCSNGGVTAGDGLVGGIAGATTVAAVVRKRMEFGRKTISKSAPSIESFEGGMAESSVER